MDEKFTRWVKRILDTQDDEINCSTCLDQVSQYVDLELSHGNAAERMPQVKQHLDQCGVCFDEYQVLRELARLENEGRSPSNDELTDRLKGSPE